MPLFQCSQCGCVENTALSDYWWDVQREKQQPRCSECKTGQWHGAFPKQDAAEEGYRLGADGFLYGPMEAPTHTTIIGPVPPVQKGRQGSDHE